MRSFSSWRWHLDKVFVKINGETHYLWRAGDLLSPEREPREVLDKIKADIGNYAFQAQFQQNPSEAENEFFTMDDLHLVDTLPDGSHFTCRVQSWDTAAKDGPRCDCSVGLTFG